MPLDLQIIRAREFVRLGTEGHFDFESTRAVLKTLADACHKRGIERALIDVRESSSDLTPNDLADLVKSFGEAGFTKRLRLAVLHAGDQEFRAKLFALISTLGGWTVYATENFEDALDWVALEGDSRPSNSDSTEDAASVPIKRPTE